MGIVGRHVGRVSLAAVAVGVLAAGFLLFLALRPAEPAPVRPIDIDIPVEGGDVENRIEIDLPTGGAVPVSPLPPPPAGGGSSDDDGGGDDDGDDDDGDDQPDDGDENDDEGDDDGGGDD